MSLKYLAIGRLARDPQGNFVAAGHEIVGSYLQTPDDPAGVAYATQVVDIMKKGARKLIPDKRIRLTSELNEYDLHVVADAFAGDKTNIVVFFAVTDNEFSKHHSVSSLLNDMKTELYKVVDADDLLKPATEPVTQKIAALLTEVASRYVTNPSDVKKSIQEAKDELSRQIDQVADRVEAEDQKRGEEPKVSRLTQEMHVHNVKSRNRKVVAIFVILVISILSYVVDAASDATKN